MSGIPHIIHYCWFGGHPLPEEYRHYIDSWRKYCPDFEIREWSELNFHKNIGGGVHILPRGTGCLSMGVCI